MRDKILKLIHSPSTQDVILGIHLAVKHLDDCEQLFSKLILKYDHEADYIFYINNKIYIFYSKNIWKEHPNNLKWKLSDFKDGEIKFD